MINITTIQFLLGGRLPPGLALPGMDSRLLAASLQQAGGLPSPCSLARSLAESAGLPHLGGGGPEAGMPHLTPNLYEMAALTQELDTVVSNKIYPIISL